MSFVVEAALAVSFEALFSKIASSNFKLVCSEQVYKQIEKWDKTLKMIYAVLADAEGKQMQNQAVKIWLADLKDLAYDVDDILDEFATKSLERKLMKKHVDQASTSKISKLLTFGFTSHASFNNKMMSKMREITERLENLAAQKSEFQLTDQNGVKGVIPKLPESSSLMDGTAIYGRHKEMEEILGMLLSNDDNISVIPIVGMGGIGKTTLAQFVYNDDSVKHHFDLRAWVCVSDQFNTVNITKTILSSVSSQQCAGNDLDLLQCKLKEKLSGKKFLLVLDDVWNENYGDWDVLKRPFAVGAPGSRVIVTTRNSNVSSLMRTVPDHHLLLKLSDDDSLCILAHHALGAKDFSGNPELEVIGREIMKKCDGLPLAIKTIGGLLRNNFNREAWRRILESQIWNSTEDRCHIMPALWLSYYHLPSQLKQCFAYCSLIPKDCIFEEEEIIPLWKAEGFLHQATTIMSSEDLGRQYFEELVSRSFFQPTDKEKSKFTMHDLINDLAQSIAQEFCFRMEERQQKKISTRTRHLSYTVGRYNGFERFQDVYEAKHLRTFHSFRIPVFYLNHYDDGFEKFQNVYEAKHLRFHSVMMDDRFYLNRNVVIDLMSKLKYMRVLSLKRCMIYEIPDSIGNLKRIRCLDFSYTRIKCLPASICNLYNLETLILRCCTYLTKLPSNMGILANLCHLDIFGANSIQKMPSGIGRLTNLQVLSNFIVGQGDAASITELRDLSGLKGKLSISGLRNMNDAGDAFEAKMSNKSGLSDLKLEWCYNFDKNLRKKEAEGDVLSFLEPHKELKSLTISYYAGSTFASWIAVPSFEKLQSLTLEGCRNCTSLPAVGKLPLLKDLCIKGMDGVTSVGNEFYGENLTNVFPSLESLCFENMPKWQEWRSWEVDEQGKSFHRLQELYIRDCPKLVKLFYANALYGFCSLEELQIFGCKELRVSISTLPKLHAIKIDGCKELKVSISTLPKLRALKIDECKEVVFGSYSDLCSVNEVFFSNVSKFAGEWLTPLESVRDLYIRKCPEVVSVGATKIKEEEKEGHLNLPCKIGHMGIQDFQSLEKISKSFQNLRCLSELKIISCGKLVSVETNSLPPTLKYLEISGCENLQCLLDDRENVNFSSTSLLESLTVGGCKGLKLLSSSCKLPLCLKSLNIDFCQELEFVAHEIRDEARLESIKIFGCKKIKYLPQGLDKLSSLHRIDIDNCPELECLPESGLPTYTNLKSMILRGCEKLQALPQLNFLDRLQHLQIRECPRLKSIFSEGSFDLPTNLTELEVGVPDMITVVKEWGLHRLTSVENLTIFGSISIAQEKYEIEMKLPTSLTSLHIQDFKNLRKISSNTFQNLTSLQFLYILNCPKLKSLPKKEMLPSLLSLVISKCPELKKRCQRDKGKLWSNITHIPEVKIDGLPIYHK